jgi:hypothetical protein
MSKIIFKKYFKKQYNLNNSQKNIFFKKILLVLVSSSVENSNTMTVKSLKIYLVEITS